MLMGNTSAPSDCAPQLYVRPSRGAKGTPLPSGRERMSMKLMMRILGITVIAALTFKVARASGSSWQVALLTSGAAVTGTALNWI
jgi:hypothetical protein